MIKLLEKNLNCLFIAILLFFISNQSFAQTCPTPTNLAVSISNGQLGLYWTSNPNTMGYNVTIAFDKGPLSGGAVLSPSYAVTIPATATSAKVSITPLCLAGGLGPSLKAFVITTQGDINKDCTIEPTEMMIYCGEVAALDPSIEIVVQNKNENCPSVSFTKEEFCEDFCEDICDTKKGNGRLPSQVPTKVVPNPFDQNFNIQFSLKENTEVSASLYASNGQLVRQLTENEPTEAGVHNLKFEGHDLPAGLYMVHLSIGGEMSVHKLVKVD